MKVDSQLITSTSTELRGMPLRQGQVLAAIVLRSDNAKGEALLSLAGGQLSVQTRLSLQAGTALQLNVRALGPPLVLQPLPGTSGGTGPVTTGQTVQTQLLTMLFQRTSQMTAQNTSTGTVPPTPAGTYSGQLSPSMATTNPAQTPGMTTSGQMQTSTTTTAALLQSGSGTALSGLMSGNTARGTNLTLAALPTAVRMALPQLDVPPAPAAMATTLAKLVTTYSLPTLGDRQTARDVSTGDLKTQLKLAAQAIKTSLNAPSTGTQTTEGRTAPMPTPPGPAQQAHVLNTLNDWVNNLDVSQLRTALQQVQGQASWIVDLPVVVAEQPRRLQLAVNQDEENDGAHDGTGSGSGWQLDFALDLPELGPLHGSLHLQSADLTVRLYADATEARQRLSASLDRLDAQLRRAHLNPQLSVYPGPPPAVVQARLSPEPARPDDTTRHSWHV